MDDQRPAYEAELHVCNPKRRRRRDKGDTSAGEIDAWLCERRGRPSSLGGTMDQLRLPPGAAVVRGRGWPFTT